VLLWNERGEVTESTIANVVVEVAGGLVTPPLACGLLPGVHRAELLERGVVRERVLTLDDVRASPRVYLVNSLRGMWEVEVGWGHEALLAAGASADAR
jgi:para-aminobenzoate synthetase/4-amino-4-deoxychorismate lyase